MNVSEDQTCTDIVRLLDVVKNAMLELADAQGITRIQLVALYLIQKHGELPMGKIADVLHCDPSNVTGLVDRLVTQGLVVRQECPTDRRTKTLCLTDKGNKTVQAAQAELPIKLGCHHLTASERHTLHQLLHKMVLPTQA